MILLKSDVNWYNKTTSDARVIGWISGGVASLVACHLALEKYANVHLAFCDTGIEHPDTYRFISDYEKFAGVKVHHYKSERFSEPEEVWLRYKGLNFAHGAPCSTLLKREVRVKQVEKLETDYCQIFGFDFCKKEINRAKNMTKNHPEINPKFPLIENEITRNELFKIVGGFGIAPPLVYKNFNNNNCIGADDSPKGGCVQGGVGYWQKMKRIYPKKFEYMAKMEHRLSKMKGEPVTICKNQQKIGKGDRLYLLPNPDHPEIKDISIIKGREPVGYMECNGFCGAQGELIL